MPLTVKSTPVCRMALPQVSPSMPTQAEDEWLLVLPEGSRGVGTVNVPVTVLKVPYRCCVSAKSSGCYYYAYTASNQDSPRPDLILSMKLLCV